MRKIIHSHFQFWSTDRSLTTLMGLLVIDIFVLHPLSELVNIGSVNIFYVIDLVFSLILISGIISVAKSRFITILVIIFALSSFLTLWMTTLVPSLAMASLNNCMAILFLGMILVLVMYQVLREGPITMQRILGAVVVYLMLGLVFANAYKLVELLLPGSFNFVGPPVTDHDFNPKTRLIYFSFTTLTSLGYGDITPVHPIARSLSMLEGLIGQLFPVILIARLVSMEIYYRRIQMD